MDELNLPDPRPEVTRPVGDVDDLLFSDDADWYASER